MATLVSGQQYGLSSNLHNSSQKSLIFVKLTDTAIKAIEEYVKNALPNSNQQPKIQFLSSDGVMLIPRNKEDQPARFGFSVSSYPESDGSFDCLQQTGSRSITSLGSMLHKMHIHATEDSYEKTRHRVAEVEQKCKNYGTKVIKASGPFVGRKVKVKQPLSTIVPPRPPISSPPSYQNKVLGNMNSSQYSFNSQRNAAANSNISNNNNRAKVNRPTSDVMKRSYRERVIHLLAVRSYKKPEILARLMKDGVKEKDKKSLSSVLTQVATCKGNTYDLARHIWNEVNEDWPFYTESEKQLVKRRKPQNLTPPGENLNPDSSPASLKRPTGGYDPNPTKKQRISHYQKTSEVSKCSVESAPVQLQTTVQQNSASYHNNNNNNNVSNPVRRQQQQHKNMEVDSGHSNGSSSSYNNNNNDMKVNYENRLSMPKVNSDSNVVAYDSSSNSPFGSHHNGSYNEDRSSSSALPRSGTSLSAFKNLHSTSSKVNSTGSSPSSSPESVDSNDSGFTGFHKYSDDDDFVSKYHMIKNADQRAEYKSDFNNEYEEYKALYKKITNVSKIFSTLGNNLKSVPEGSQEYMKIKSQIVEQYQNGKCRKDYQGAKRRFQYLHDKLAHIKRLIVDFDRTRCAL